jgi:hypothetical protein
MFLRRPTSARTAVAVTVPEGVPQLPEGERAAVGGDPRRGT